MSSGTLSGPWSAPASTSTTLFPGSSESRAAITQPAEPPPITRCVACISLSPSFESLSRSFERTVHPILAGGNSPNEPPGRSPHARCRYQRSARRRRRTRRRGSSPASQTTAIPHRPAHSSSRRVRRPVDQLPIGSSAHDFRCREPSRLASLEDGLSLLQLDAPRFNRKFPAAVLTRRRLRDTEDAVRVALPFIRRESYGPT